LIAQFIDLLNIHRIAHPCHYKQNQNFNIHHIVNETQSLHIDHLYFSLYPIHIKNQAQPKTTMHNLAKGGILVDHVSFFCAGSTPAINYASKYLIQHHLYAVNTLQQAPDIVILDVPSFSSDGTLRGGNNIEYLLDKLADSTTLCGGNLDLPILADRKRIDLLKDETYLTENAAITAYCTLQIAADNLPIILNHAPTLVIGWGRIGKHLVDLLKKLGADVSVAVRNPSHLATLNTISIPTAPIENWDPSMFRLIINTVPSPIMDINQIQSAPETVFIDLASIKGLCAPQVLWARGLPGIHAPETSGQLIAKTIIRLYQEEAQ